MGGVAIREYVQGPNYNRDVDKIVTLDSPHEGTGALSALLDLSDYRHQLGDALSSSVVAAMSAAGIAMITMGKEPSILYPALITLSVSLRYEAFQQIIKEIAWNFYFKENGYDYRSDDLLAEYINPEKKNAGINNLKNRSVGADFPMARFLGAENSMTFTDPNASYREVLNTLIPEAFSVPISNVGYQIFGDGSATTRVVNAETGFVLGLAGINVQDNGSALIPTASGLAQNTSALGSGNVDIVRKTFDAAVHAETGDQNVFSDVFTAVGLSLIATDVAMSWCEACKIGAKIAIGTAGALYLSGGIVSSSYLGIQDLKESHDIPKNSKFHREHFGDKKTYSRVKGGSETVEPLLMEDFLYERPFVNLSLFVSDSALRAVEPDCYYEADSASKQQLCEVGLYDSLGNVVATTNGKMDYADFRKSPPLKFKSESDWSRMGLKLDRWERVNGLSPSGDSAKIPIRHVERYAVPDITVDNFIEKYSFVVDDLMPHRLRQIRLNFNYQEEIAWECDVTKDPSAGDACTVYKRSGGSGWDTLQLEKHPVQKDGRFDFEPRKYNYTILSALQKDNQNTVTISTVNKIGLSNTQRLYYLFKATANKLDPVWPQRDVVLNRIKGFKSHATALGYQGYRVEGATDTIFRTDGTSSFPRLDMNMAIDSVFDASRIGQPGVSATGFVYDSSGAHFASRQHDGDPAEGSYLWKFVADIRNTAAMSSGADSSNTYEVPFRVDRTAPDFTLEPERSVMNPDSMPFTVALFPQVIANHEHFDYPCQ